MNGTMTPQRRNKAQKVELILSKREDNRLDLGVVPRPVLRCGIPLQRPPKDYIEHTARDGNCQMRVLADPHYGMPFGRDLITQVWLYSEAYAQKSRTIRFDSGRAMLRSMGLNEDGPTFKWVTHSIERVFGATWEYSIEHERGDKVQIEKQWFRFVSAATLWFNKDRDQLDFDAEGFQNSITLTEDAYALAMKRGFQSRLELEVIAHLSQAPGATRLFMILRDRAAQVPEHKPYAWMPLTGPYGLDYQVGVKPYPRQRRWRELVSKWLEVMGDVWGDAPKPDDIHQGRDGFYRLKVPRAPAPGKERVKPSTRRLCKTF